MFGFFQNRRRQKLLAEPFPDWWEAILRRNVAHYAMLSEGERAKVRDILRVLIAEKSWEGRGGLHITDEIKITIAAVSSLVLLGIEHDYFSRVDAILVYPGSFQTPNLEDDWEDDFISETVAEGQAVYRGPVILGWRHVLDESRDPSCGHNVVIHEFAHQLDFLDGAIDGTPPLATPADEANWAKVMTAAFRHHQDLLKRGRKTFFTQQAGDDETEFFAAASESFYCQPHDLDAVAPAVYELLMGYYRVDPRAWAWPESNVPLG